MSRIRRFFGRIRKFLLGEADPTLQELCDWFKGKRISIHRAYPLPQQDMEFIVKSANFTVWKAITVFGDDCQRERFELTYGESLSLYNGWRLAISYNEQAYVKAMWIIKITENKQ